MQNIQEFLNNDKLRRRTSRVSWNSLDHTTKILRLQEFAYGPNALPYVPEGSTLEDHQPMLYDFLKTCLVQKRLSRVKDVLLDSEGVILDIPMLQYNPTKRNYTLRQTMA
jgi:hypothetical protein